MVLPTLNWIEMIDEIQKKSHRAYLDNWETKTQRAEREVWDQEIQIRALETIEDLASELDVLAFALKRIIEMNDLKFIDEPPEEPEV